MKWGNHKDTGPGEESGDGDECTRGGAAKAMNQTWMPQPK